MGVPSARPLLSWFSTAKFHFGVSIVPSSHLLSKQKLIARAERVVALNWIVRSTKAPPPPRFTRQSQKEKMFLALLIFAGVDFFWKRKGHFSFWGSAFQVFRQCGGASIRTRFCENYFLGIWIFAKPRLICFWILSARRRGLGRNPRGLFGNFRVRPKNAKMQLCKYLLVQEVRR